MNNYGLGGIYRPKGSSRFWIRYSNRGKQIRESSGSASEAKARALLKRRLGEIAAGKFAGPVAERTKISELLDALITHYEITGARSLRTTKSIIKHLHGYFSDDRVVDVTTPRLREYIAQRQRRKAAPASIRRELAHLHHAMRLAVQDGRLNAIPSFPSVRVDNIRRGFIEGADFQRLLTALPRHLRVPAEFLYVTGWRSHEMQTLRWRDVDFNGGQIVLDPVNDKTSKITVLHSIFTP